MCGRSHGFVQTAHQSVAYLREARWHLKILKTPAVEVRKAKQLRHSHTFFPYGHAQFLTLASLYQKSASCFRSLHESFQPTKVWEEDERAGKQHLAQVIKVETSLSAYSSSSVLC